MSASAPPAAPSSSSNDDPNKKSREALISRIAGLGIIVAIVIYAAVTDPNVAFAAILFGLPVVIGAVVMLISSDQLTTKTEEWQTGFQQKLAFARTADGKFQRWFKRPLYGGFIGLWKLTQSIKLRHVRAALRLTGLLYFAGIMIYLLVTVVYIIVALEPVS